MTHGYRRDIDGLRAIAVGSVVLYHAFEAWLPGGFIGVDIFFVISGYLITGLIAADLERREFSIQRFYVRRAKRILPALFVVLVGTLALGLVLLTPTDVKGLGRTGAATAAFVSNIVFWFDTGYFDTGAEAKPLLHTWSLAVEEQFYVLWPPTLWWLWGRSAKRLIVAAIVAVSFALSCYFVVWDQSTAFFLLPTRAWQLLAGAALALGMVPEVGSRPRREAAAFVGLALIAGAALLLNRQSQFPGWAALPPCVGAMLLIAAGEKGDHLISRHLLATRPMVFVGLISYSLYLWHWPLLSLARLAARGELSVTEVVAIVAAAVALAVATWRYVETPLRAKASTPAARPVLVRYALVSIAAVAIGLALYRTNGLLATASPEVVRAERARYDVNPLSGPCLRWQADTRPLPTEPCLEGETQHARRLVIWGDSHADALAPGFAALAAKAHHRSHQLTMAGCPPLVGVELQGAGADYEPCATFNERVAEYVTSHADVSTVALIARWTLYSENARFGDDPGPITFLVDEDDRIRSTEASKRVFVRALRRTVDSLMAAGKSVVVLGGVPPIGLNVPDCLARNRMRLSGTRPCDVDAAAVRSHLEFSDSLVAGLAAGRQGVCTFLPQQVFCPGQSCLTVVDDEILYANDDHLSVKGALFLAQSYRFDACLRSARAE